jgi:hypothetical protein
MRRIKSALFSETLMVSAAFVDDMIDCCSDDRGSL